MAEGEIPAEADVDADVAEPARPTPSRARPAGIGRIVAVGSGKGGVGKSTVAVNLALALARRGHRVGLLDADVHGPNVPLMLGVRRRGDAAGWEAIVPLATAVTATATDPVPDPASGSAGTRSAAAGSRRPLPALDRYGIKVMSLGLLAGEDQALLAGNAPLVGVLVRGLLSLVDWGPLDLLLIDLPPGTGEPLATLLASVALDGALLVVTPQDVARLDTGRALAAFRGAGVPVLGSVENMSFLICPSCGERIEVFHRGRVPRAVSGDDVPRLAELPLDPVVSEAGDIGRPVVVAAPEGVAAARFLALAEKVEGRLGLGHGETAAADPESG